MPWKLPLWNELRRLPMLRTPPITCSARGARRVTNGVAEHRRRPAEMVGASRMSLACGALAAHDRVKRTDQAMKTKLLRRAGAFLLLAASLAGARAESPDASDEAFDMTAANLMVVLRESPGVNKQDEALEPFGKISAKLPDGRVIEFEASWFQYLGDMHLRLVFDGLKRVQSALPGDLLKLKLSPEEALARAVDNLRERYGPPII